MESCPTHPGIDDNISVKISDLSFDAVKYFYAPAIKWQGHIVLP
jgi:hypothetical protein